MLMVQVMQALILPKKQAIGEGERKGGIKSGLSTFSG
jgi:hypothetical protein